MLQVKDDLQDKSSQWNNESLLVKLQRSYVLLQFDLPYFIARQEIAIQEGTREYKINFTVIKNMTFRIDGREQEFVGLEKFYEENKKNTYTIYERSLILSEHPKKECLGEFVYKYEKTLANENCEIEIHTKYYEALRLLFLSQIHEKPTLNSKQRNLSTHYLNLYAIEVQKQKSDNRVKAKNITSNYQVV